MNKDDVIVLIDEPLNVDRRVQSFIKNFHEPFIEDCSGISPFSHSMYLLHSWMLIKSLIFIPFFWFKLNKKYKLRPKAFLAGIKHSLRI